MQPPWLQLLASPGLRTSVGSVPLPGTRPYQLLAYLACRNTWVRRDTVASLFWPEREASTARASLRFVLTQIRRLVPDAGLETRSDLLRCAIATDVQRFELAVAGREWEAAVDLYCGQLLEGFELAAPAPFVDWLLVERLRLDSVWRDALAARLAQLEADPSACVALAGRALIADPLDDAALASQLRALAALGRIDDACRAYRDYADRLAIEVGIEPSAALRELVRQLGPHAAGRTTDTPTVVGAAPDPAAPAPVGRRVELARLRQTLLGDGCRVLTVSGPGGVGKSLLARTALPLLASELADQAFWIALDDLQAIEQVAPRCAAVLGIEPQPSSSPQQQLIERLRTARALLVFDNAEHLAGFAPWLECLLAACDRLRVLVTSRARLNIAAEWQLPLEGLPVPDADETETDAMRAFDAVRLFELRAGRVHPDFDARANAPEVAALVRAVDGLPLAIELAAVWVRVLPVAEIRRELARSLDLLDAGDAGGGRSHSVRDSFAHSWRLLVPAEQRALLRLAVFQGHFSRESARAVADAALPLLAALVDKSLLHSAEQGRFGFHPLIQQFTLEKLDQLGVDQVFTARSHHAEYFLALMARYDDFQAIGHRVALQAIGAEFGNVLAAWRWAVTQRRVDLLQGCASALKGYLNARGEMLVGQAQFDLAAAVIDDNCQEHQFARCEVQGARAAFCYWRGAFHDGEAAARAALQAAHRARSRLGVVTNTNMLGLFLWRLGRMKEAAFCLRDVVRRTRADADPADVPLYAGNLGGLEHELGNYDEAERLFMEALDGHRRVGHHWGIQVTLNELSLLRLSQARPQEALRFAREAFAIAADSGVRHSVPYSHRNLARAFIELNDLAAAESHTRLAFDAARQGGDRSIEPSCRVLLADIALHRGDPAAALLELQEAARLGSQMRSPRVQLLIAAAYARWCLGRSRTDQARTLLWTVVDHPAVSRYLREQAARDIAALPDAASKAGESPGNRDMAGLDQALDCLLTERL